jgi:hypothetical protein
MAVGCTTRDDPLHAGPGRTRHAADRRALANPPMFGDGLPVGAPDATPVSGAVRFIGSDLVVVWCHTPR